jgi:hypothetical protein
MKGRGAARTGFHSSVVEEDTSSIGAREQLNRITSILPRAREKQRRASRKLGARLSRRGCSRTLASIHTQTSHHHARMARGQVRGWRHHLEEDGEEEGEGWRGKRK